MQLPALPSSFLTSSLVAHLNAEQMSKSWQSRPVHRLSVSYYYPRTVSPGEGHGGKLGGLKGQELSHWAAVVVAVPLGARQSRQGNGPLLACRSLSLTVAHFPSKGKGRPCGSSHHSTSRFPRGIFVFFFSFVSFLFFFRPLHPLALLVSPLVPSLPPLLDPGTALKVAQHASPSPAKP